MFERSLRLTAEQSDELAAKYYFAGDYSSALKQNLETQRIVGKEIPATLKNTAICYSYLFEPLKAIDTFKKYFEMIERRTADDYVMLAGFYGQSGQLGRAEDTLSKCPYESFQVMHDKVMHMFRNEKYELAFRTFDSIKRKYNVLWVGETRWSKIPSCPRWTGESLAGKKVCVVGECGLGDEIAFSRWLPQLIKIAKTVDYLTDNTLIDVFERNYQGLGRWDDTNTYDYWLPSMNLPIAVNSYIPGSYHYLTASEQYIDKWRRLLPKGKKVCFNWTGSANFSQNIFRNIPVDSFLAKLDFEYVPINVCLETRYNPAGMLDLRDQISSWEDTLAILEISNIVVSSCSSVAHAAGAIGKKTYVYTRPDDYFTWSSTESGKISKWYDTVTVWRTKKIGQWDDIIDQSKFTL